VAKITFNGGVGMTSKQEPYSLHAAIFPSLAAISAVEGDKMLVTFIDARYSKTIGSNTQRVQSQFIKRNLNRMEYMVEIRWNVEETGHPVTVKEILKDLKANGIPDAILKKITFAIPWTIYNNEKRQNENIHVSWSFRPQTFRKGIWKRLKALSHYPGKELYEKYCQIKDELVEQIAQPTRKRWRDTILLNEPHPELDNAEFRSFWQGKRFALILKQSRGSFDLLDIGEWRA